MPNMIPSVGPEFANIMIVGDCPGYEDMMKLTPFSSQAGEELSTMLHDAGIPRLDCRITYACPYEAPENYAPNLFLDKKCETPGPLLAEGLKRLYQEIVNCKPMVIIALGNIAMWALTGKQGITSWRGSELGTDHVMSIAAALPRVFKVIPTYHPDMVLKVYEWRWITVHDFRRAKDNASTPFLNTPDYEFIVRPSFDQTMNCLARLHKVLDESPEGYKVSIDIETRSNLIACVGLATSKLHAICIPFMCLERDTGYWEKNLELAIVKELRLIMLHPNIRVVGQNFLYDDQYFALYMGVAPIPYMDTMLAQHVAFPGMPKGLDFLSSLYCNFHQYWKDEGKEWNPRTTPEEQLWIYNCKDAVITYECSDALEHTLKTYKLWAPFQFQMSLFKPILRMMLRGVCIDHKLRSDLYMELMELTRGRHEMINKLSGRQINPQSPKQLMEYFYDTLGLPVQKHKKTKKPTCDDEALLKLASREPLVRRLVGAINEYRTLNASLNVVDVSLDFDNKLRCSYNISGAETFRFSSSKNAFRGGTNLQNITSGGKSEETGLPLPNLRKLIVPPTGYEICEVDLNRADLQVVVWEADDNELREMLRLNVDMHCYSAVDIFNIRGIPLEELAEDHPNYKEHRGRIGEEYRQQTKAGVHLTNYYGQPPTLARTLGITVRAAEQFQNKWFGAHPGIKNWHNRTRDELQRTRCIYNKFGYRRFYFDRVESILPEALAWVPQSTVAIVINHGIVNVENNLPEVEIILQVHDSAGFQYLIANAERLRPLIAKNLLITVPYPTPLIIPVTLKASTKSWGDCKAV